jgi:hypothetical protein
MPAGTRPAVPAAERTGTVASRPAVWTRDCAPPSRAVWRVFDGMAYYRRTPADRWLAEPRPGPGLTWPEIPGALRVDASRDLAPGVDGALTLAGSDAAAGADPHGPAPSRPALAGTQGDGRPAVRRRRRPQVDLPLEVLDLVDLSPRYEAR